MQQSAVPIQKFETIDSPVLDVACEGIGGALGHPRVYLHIDPEVGAITCPYCSRTFRHVTGH